MAQQPLLDLGGLCGRRQSSTSGAPPGRGHLGVHLLQELSGTPGAGGGASPRTMTVPAATSRRRERAPRGRRRDPAAAAPRRGGWQHRQTRRSAVQRRTCDFSSSAHSTSDVLGPGQVHIQARPRRRTLPDDNSGPIRAPQLPGELCSRCGLSSEGPPDQRHRGLGGSPAAFATDPGGPGLIVVAGARSSVSPPSYPPSFLVGNRAGPAGWSSMVKLLQLCQPSTWTPTCPP